MGKIVDFFGALCARRQADEKQTLSHERIEYLRQAIGTELYNVADRMPVVDVLAALDLIRADVQRHSSTGSRIV